MKTYVQAHMRNLLQIFLVEQKLLSVIQDRKTEGHIKRDKRQTDRGIQRHRNRGTERNFQNNQNNFSLSIRTLST